MAVARPPTCTTPPPSPSSRNADAPSPGPRAARAGERTLEAGRAAFRPLPLTWESKHGQVPFFLVIWITILASQTYWGVKRFLKRDEMCLGSTKGSTWHVKACSNR